MDLDKYFYGVRKAFGYNTPEEDALFAQRRADAYAQQQQQMPAQSAREAPVIPSAAPQPQPVPQIELGGMAGQAISEMEKRRKLLDQ